MVSEEYKKQLLEYMLANRKIGEACFKRRFPDVYIELRETAFPENFSFRQRIFHYLNNDRNLELGLCECGNRCSFKSLNEGYNAHCSKRCATKSDEVQRKRETTCIRKYGVAHESKCERIKGMKRETCLRNHGVMYPMQSVEVLETRSRNNMEKFGIPYTCMSNNKGFAKESGPNTRFGKMLENEGIVFEREFFIERYYYDFKIGNYLIEIDPTVTHNSHSGVFGSIPKSANYHYDKTTLAEQYGYVCVHVWDWSDKTAIVKSLKNGTIHVTETGNVVLHWYNMKTNSHIAGDCDYAEMVESGYLPVYDDGRVTVTEQ